MSFTAEVKDELSRVVARRACCPRAELSALVRVEGTLHFTGNERFRLEIATETAPVARKAIKLLHSLYDLSTELTVRRSVLHKSNNYLITVPAQPKLAQALHDLGILDDSLTPSHGIPRWLVKKDCCAVSYLRGAFLGGGFVADPHGDFHFELTAESEQIAEDLSAIMARFEMNARITQRRGTYAVYLKGAEPIVTFRALVGAHHALLRTEDVRIIKGVRNDVTARQRETGTCRRGRGIDVANVAIKHLADTAAGRLPPALRELAAHRLEYPDASLRELGAGRTSAQQVRVYHRIRRLETRFWT